MFELAVEVESAVARCPAAIPMEPGVGLVVRSEKLFSRDGSPICLFALQSLMPFFTAKQRPVAPDDWMARVHHGQCPHPRHRVLWRLEQRPIGTTICRHASLQRRPEDVRVMVEEIRGCCTSGTAIGDEAVVHDGLLYLPQPFCLWALQTALPGLASRTVPRCVNSDRRQGAHPHDTVICPDPAGAVVLRIGD